MKKLITFLFLLLAFTPSFAFILSEEYTFNSRFWRSSTKLAATFSPNMFFAFRADAAKHKNFEHRLYTLSAPLGLGDSSFGVILTPFVAPDNSNGAKAYGATGKFSIFYRPDDISFLEWYFGASAARHKASLVKNGLLTDRERFGQAAFETGALWNLYGYTEFKLSGNIYRYRSNLSDIDGLRGVLNQADLADLGTKDYVFRLPKSSFGAYLSFSEFGSTGSFSLRYIQMHHSKDEISLFIGTQTETVGGGYLQSYYNHIFISGETDKDIYGLGLCLAF